MHLELTSEEVRELKTCVESEIRRCFEDLTHADNREFRAETRARAARLQEIERKVDVLVTGPEAEAYA